MLPFVAIGLCAASLLFNIIGLALPYWLKFSNLGVSATYGLWTVCKDSLLGKVCASLPSVPSAWQATRAMEILGMLVIASALGCVILKQFVMKDNAIIPKIGGGCGVAAGILMILGTIIFATANGVASSGFNAGFALCIVAGVIGIAAGIVIFLAFRGGE